MRPGPAIVAKMAARDGRWRTSTYYADTSKQESPHPASGHSWMPKTSRAGYSQGAALGNALASSMQWVADRLGALWDRIFHREAPLYFVTQEFDLSEVPHTGTITGITMTFGGTPSALDHLDAAALRGEEIDLSVVIDKPRSPLG